MKKSNTLFNRFFTALVFLFLYAPIAVLIIFSFNEGNSSTVWKGFSLQWYEQLFQNRLIMRSVYTTLLVSVLATLIATIAGTFAAIGFYAMRKKYRDPLMTVNNIPMMNADIVTGVSMCLLFVAFFGFWNDFVVWFNSMQAFFELPRLKMGFGTLLIAHIGFNIPYIILSVSPKLRQMDKNLVDAAQDLGCTWMQAFWLVILPEIKPGIISGALTAFTMSVDDFIISYFVAGSSTSTLAMTIYGMTKKRITPEINAISTLLFLFVLALLVIINVREARMERRREQEKEIAKYGVSDDISAAELPETNPWMKRAIVVAVAVAVVFGVKAMNSVNDQRVVNVCSWGEYIDEDLILQFEEETGIAVNYQTAESNEALYSLLKTGAGDYDVIVPSDYMIARLAAEGMLAELDYSRIPNYALIGDAYKNLSYDPDGKYTVAYTWGTLGIIYNTTMVDEPITSWRSMFDTKYAGNVLMIRSSRDALAAGLLCLGYDINTTNEQEIREAYELLKEAKANGVYQAFVMDEVYNKMEGGNAALAIYYAGDYLTMLDNNPDLAYVVPEEGSNWFVDAMCVLKDAENYDEAMEWMNFIAGTQANLQNMDYVWYASPNTEALEQYPAYYEELYEEELEPEIFEIMAAPQDVLDRCSLYENLPGYILTLYNDLWTELGI